MPSAGQPDSTESEYILEGKPPAGKTRERREGDLPSGAVPPPALHPVPGFTLLPAFGSSTLICQERTPSLGLSLHPSFTRIFKHQLCSAERTMLGSGNRIIPTVQPKTQQRSEVHGQTTTALRVPWLQERLAPGSRGVEWGIQSSAKGEKESFLEEVASQLRPDDKEELAR